MMYKIIVGKNEYWIDGDEAVWEAWDKVTQFLEAVGSNKQAYIEIVRTGEIIAEYEEE